MDELHQEILTLVGGAGEQAEDRFATFEKIWKLTADVGAMQASPGGPRGHSVVVSREPIPHLSEPWYC
jgi:hypothetical protein